MILKLTPRYQNGQWVRWNQEFPPGTSAETLTQGEEFSGLKVGFRGALKFWDGAEIMEVAPLLLHAADGPDYTGPNFYI